MKKFLSVVLLGLSLTSLSFAETKVNKIECGEGVENKEVVNPSDTLPNNIGKIYCLSSIETDEAPTNI